jgi:hypothetical protein
MKKRRQWLLLLLPFLCPPFIPAGKAQPPACCYTERDKQIFEAWLDFAQLNGLSTRERGECLLAIGCYFTGSPYVAGTLEGPGEEQLRVNLRAFDCTTFVETVLALYYTIHQSQPSFDLFCQQLLTIRYRGGHLQGYLSRLHYLSEWIVDNEKKGIVQLIDRGPYTASFPVQVSYMSTHPAQYPALQANPALIPALVEQENRISQLKLPYIPKEQVDSLTCIQPGDILAITTHVPGLDYAHIGIAYPDSDGHIHLLHASTDSQKVVVSDQTLTTYLSGIAHHTGLTVIRPREPAIKRK